MAQFCSKAVVSLGVPERVDIAVGQEQIVLDSPGVGMRSPDLDEVEPVGGVDSDACCHKPLLQVRVLAQGALGEGMFEQRRLPRHQGRSHDEVGETVFSLGESADDDIAAPNVQVVSLFSDEVGGGEPQGSQLVGQIMGSIDIVIVHFGNDLSRRRCYPAVEADPQGLASIDLHDLQVLHTSVPCSGLQVGGHLESVSDEHQLLVVVDLSGMGAQHVAEVCGAIR